MFHSDKETTLQIWYESTTAFREVDLKCPMYFTHRVTLTIRILFQEIKKQQIVFTPFQLQASMGRGSAIKLIEVWIYNLIICEWKEKLGSCWALTEYKDFILLELCHVLKERAALWSRLCAVLFKIQVSVEHSKRSLRSNRGTVPLLSQVLNKHTFQNGCCDKDL